MRRWLGGIAAILLFLGVASGTEATAVDCGPAASVKCLAAAVFSLARTLPADDFFRKHVAFAEQELASGDLKVALDYVVSDNPDSPPWEDIEWIARAGRFDRAIKIAKERASSVERLGGMLAVATEMLDKNDRGRAQKIVEEVERELPSIPHDGNDMYAGALPSLAGEVWAGLGQPDRVVRLVSGEGATSVDNLMAIAGRYPAVAARLRELAWLEAERANELRAWQQLLESAISRGEIASAAQRVGQAIDRTTKRDSSNAAIALARVFLTAGVPERAAKLIEPWPQWLDGKDAVTQFNTVNALMPVLAGLAREDDVKKAASAVIDVYQRSQCLSSAAQEYFRLGQREAAERFDGQAFALAQSPPAAGQSKPGGGADFVLHNLALLRADHGDIQGALDVVGKLSDAAKIREVTSWVIYRAINNGHGAVAGPAIEVLQQMALANQKLGLLLHAADDWQKIGGEANAREGLSRVMKMREELHAEFDREDAGLAAELMWRLDGAGRAEAMIAIVDKLGVTDPSVIDRLIEIIIPLSPTVALQLVDKQTETIRRIDDLANIAIQIAAKPN